MFPSRRDVKEFLRTESTSTDEEEIVVGFDESQVRGLGLALQPSTVFWIFLLSESSFRTSRPSLL